MFTLVDSHLGRHHISMLSTTLRTLSTRPLTPPSGACRCVSQSSRSWRRGSRSRLRSNERTPRQQKVWPACASVPGIIPNAPSGVWQARMASTTRTLSIRSSPPRRVRVPIAAYAKLEHEAETGVPIVRSEVAELTINNTESLRAFIFMQLEDIEDLPAHPPCVHLAVLVVREGARRCLERQDESDDGFAIESV